MHCCLKMAFPRFRGGNGSSSEILHFFCTWWFFFIFGLWRAISLQLLHCLDSAFDTTDLVSSPMALTIFPFFLCIYLRWTTCYLIYIYIYIFKWLWRLSKLTYQSFPRVSACVCVCVFMCVKNTWNLLLVNVLDTILCCLCSSQAVDYLSRFILWTQLYLLVTAPHFIHPFSMSNYHSTLRVLIFGDCVCGGGWIQ